MTSFIDVLILDKNQICTLPVEKTMSERLEIPSDKQPLPEFYSRDAPAKDMTLRMDYYNLIEYGFEGKTYLVASAFVLAHFDLDGIMRQKVAEGLTPVN